MINLDQKVLDLLWRCAAKKHENVAIEGILISPARGIVVASDSTQLVLVRTKLTEEYTKEAVLDKSNKPTDLIYPNISGVFPELANHKQFVITPGRLLRCVENVPESPDKDGKRIAIKLDGKLFYPPRMKMALDIFVAMGETTIGYIVTDDRVYLHGSKVEAVVMCLRSKNSATDLICESYTIKELESLGDLF